MVGLRLTGTAVAPGAPRRYWGRVRTTDGALAWAAGSGARAVAASELSVRWQRSAADDPASAFTDIPGVAGLQALDPYGSRDGSAHYYRAVVGASVGGLAPAISNADRGLAAPGHWTGVAVGDRHACALDDGHVVCWGDDEAGQASPPAGTFTQLEARAGYSCGLSTAGEVVCWGQGFATPTTVSPPGVALTQFASGHDLATGALELCGVEASGAGTCFAASGASLAPQPTGAWLRFVDPWCGVRDDGSAACFRGGYEPITAPWYPGPYADFVPVAFVGGSSGLVGWRQDGTMASQAVCQPPYCDDIPALLPGAWSDVAFPATEWAPDPFGPRTAVCGVSAADGTLACEAPSAPFAPVLAEPTTCGAPYVDVALGAAATDGHQSACAIDGAGALRCWGASAALAAGPRVPEPSGGARHGLVMTSNVAAARRDDGTIASWGAPTVWYAAPPPMAPTYEVFVDTISPGVAHTYRLTIDGTLFTFDATFAAPGPAAKQQVLDALAAAALADPAVAARVQAVVETHRGIALRLMPRRDGTAFTVTTDDAFLDVVNVVPAGGVRAVAASGLGGLAITVDGRLAPWGPIEYREGEPWHRPPAGDDFVAVACGTMGCCAQRADHTLACLQGWDVVGRCGDDHCANAEVGVCATDCADEAGEDNGDVPAEAIGVVPPALAAVAFDAFAIGYYYCGVRADDHHLACWDANAAPVDPATTFLAPLAAAAPTAGFVQLVISDQAACGLDAQGRAVCASVYTAGLDVHAGPFVDIATTAEVTCGVRAGTGAGECWGAVTTTRPGPYVNVEAAPVFEAYPDMVCFETAGGRLDCAGDGFSGLTPPRDDAVDVLLGHQLRCFRHTDGTLACAGGAPPSTCAPWTSVELDVYACGVTADGAGRCWGSGAVEPPPGPWRVLSPGSGGNGCGLRPRPGDAPAGDGRVACWLAGAIDPPAPLPPAGTAYVEVQVAASNACARRDDGVVVCWGDPTTGITAVPALAAGDRWAQVELDGAHACGRTERGHLRCWGGGPNPPLPTPTEAGFRDFDLSGEYLCAVTATTEVRCYSTASMAAPLSGPFMGPLPGAGYVRVANDGGYDVCGVRADGTAVCTGPAYARW